jgi:hypothetical protein
MRAPPAHPISLHDPSGERKADAGPNGPAWLICENTDRPHIEFTTIALIADDERGKVVAPERRAAALND